MSTPNRFEELIEKLKAHAKANNDDQLKGIVASFDTSEEEEEDPPGENRPDPPDVP